MGEVSRIREQIKGCYEGPAWHGPALRKILDQVSPGRRLQQLHNGNNIAELVFHITAWRLFVIKRLEGDGKYDVEGATNFKAIKVLNEDGWRNLLVNLDHSQERLLALMNDLPEEKLKEQVAGRSYDFYFLLHGIIQHDLYHAGQIALLNRS